MGSSKERSASSVGYHVDADYISKQFKNPRESNSVTIWIALDDADEENGVLEFVAGSHKVESDISGGELHGGAGFHGGGDDLLDRMRENTSAKLEVIRPTIKAGFCSIHHQNTLHGSAPNKSTTRHRRALVVHLLDLRRHLPSSLKRSNERQSGVRRTTGLHLRKIQVERFEHRQRGVFSDNLEENVTLTSTFVNRGASATAKIISVDIDLIYISGR